MKVMVIVIATILGIMATMSGWSIAADMISAPSDLMVAGGFILLALIILGWVWMIRKIVASKKNKSGEVK